MERAAGHRRGGKRRPGRHFGHGDLRGELGGRGHPNDHHHRHQRYALRDGGVLHGDAGRRLPRRCRRRSRSSPARVPPRRRLRKATRSPSTSPARPTVDEGDATTNYTVSLTPSGVTPTSDLTVSYATANGTATAGTRLHRRVRHADLHQLGGGARRPSPCRPRRTRSTRAPDETFTVTISSPTGGGGPVAKLWGHPKVVTTTIDGRRRRASPASHARAPAPTSLGRGRLRNVRHRDGHPAGRQHFAIGHRGHHRHPRRHRHQGHRLHGDVAGHDHDCGRLLRWARGRSPSRRRTTRWSKATRRSVIPGTTTVSGLSVTCGYHHADGRRQVDHG